MLPILTISLAHAAECPDCTIERVRGNHHTIHTEIIIDAPPEAVWSVLTDWERLPQWQSDHPGHHRGGRRQL